jgi:hypothetical protein
MSTFIAFLLLDEGFDLVSRIHDIGKDFLPGMDCLAMRFADDLARSPGLLRALLFTQRHRRYYSFAGHEIYARVERHYGSISGGFVQRLGCR